MAGRCRASDSATLRKKTANLLGVSGYARNLDDGRVEVYASGTKEQLDDFAGRLRQGPRWADVRGFEEQEAALERRNSFETY